MCIERLFQATKQSVSHDGWKPIQITRGGPKISHLAFADDLLFFAEANLEQAEIIQQTLHNFCPSSGQKVSNEKTRVFFSKNVPRLLRKDICDVMGFQSTEDLGKYLGVPIFHQRVGLNTFNYVLEKVKQRLSNWKAKTLSFAGRAILARSVVQAMPTYVIQSCVLPRGICDEIDKLCRSFIWGDDDNNKAIHLINWETMCKPKINGGLGLRSTRAANTAFLMKGLWNFCSNPESLWGSIIRSKYKCGWRDFPKIDAKRKGSNYWNGLVNTWEEFRSNLVWNVGNGADVRFWNDVWVPNCDFLASYSNTSLSFEDSILPISDFMNYNGEWNWSLFENLLPENIVQKIINYYPPSILAQDDDFRWGGTPDGRFTTKSAYLVITNTSSLQSNELFKYVWKWKGNERIRTFLWKLAHGVILTNVERCRRTIANSSLCPMCGAADETLFHRFRDCHSSLAIWQGLKKPNQSNFFNNMNWQNWLLNNINYKGLRDSELTWRTAFGVTLDVMWRNRNDLVFSQKIIPTQESIIKIMNHVEWIEKCILRKTILQTQILPDEELQVNWSPPPDGWFKLNCDGSVKDNGREAGCGGVLRGARGDFILAFAQKLHACDVLESELQAIFNGLAISWNRGYKSLLVEMDSMEAFALLTSGCNRAHRLHRLVMDILEIGEGDIQVNWMVVGRSMNTVADSLSRESHIIGGTNVIYDHIPDFLVNLLAADGYGPAGLIHMN